MLNLWLSKEHIPRLAEKLTVVSFHVEKRVSSTGINGCMHNPPLQMERKLQICDTHRGISLLSVAGKIHARVLLNQLNVHLDQNGLISENQCGFRKDRGTIDMIFTAINSRRNAKNKM